VVEEKFHLRREGKDISSKELDSDSSFSDTELDRVPYTTGFYNGPASAGPFVFCVPKYAHDPRSFRASQEASVS
jgi:hypothetical protein